MMGTKLSSWAVLAILYLCHTTVFSQTYFIDPSAQFNGDGTTGAPAAGPGLPGAMNTWPQNIGTPGDAYYQKCGTTFTVPWENGISLTNASASSGKETILGAYYLDSNDNAVIGVLGAKPIISGLQPVPGWDDAGRWRSEGGGIWSMELGRISPHRLWLDGEERLMAGFNPSVERANPDALRRIDPAATPPIYWSHETYPPEGGGTSGQRLFVFSPGNPATSYQRMEGLQSVDRIFLIRNSNHVRLENLDIRAARRCVMVDRSNYVTIQDCEIGAGGHLGISIRGLTGGGAGYNADFGIIRRCIVDADFHFKGHLYEDQGPQYGIELKDGANGWEIYQNEIANWGHTAVNIHSLASGSPVMTSNGNKVYENLFTAPDAAHCRAFNISGAAPGRCSNNEIYRNYIYNMPTRSQVTADNNKIYYNIFDTIRNDTYFLHSDTWMTSGEGLHLWAGSDSPHCEGNQIFNNVFFNTGEAAIRLMSWGNGQWVQGNAFINNIVYQCGINAISGRESFDSGGYAGAAIVIEAWRQADDDMLRQNTFRNNLIFNGGAAGAIRYKGASLTVSEFNGRSLHGDIISDNIGQAPLFIDAASGNFALQPQSAAIGRGFDVGELFGLAIAPGAMRADWPAAISTQMQSESWDIGAIKFIAQGSDQIPPSAPKSIKVQMVPKQKQEK